MLNAILMFIFNEAKTTYILDIGIVIDLIASPFHLLCLIVNLVILINCSRRIKLYLLTEIMLLMSYIVLLSCHKNLKINILFNDVSIFGFVRLVKSILMIFICYDMIDIFYFYKVNVLVRTRPALEKKATLNIEVVVEILNNIKEKMYGSERDNIDYCIKIITNNKLFIPKILEEENNMDECNPKENNLKHEIAFWVQNFEKIEKMLGEEELAVIRRERSRVDNSKKITDSDFRNLDLEQLNVGVSRFILQADSNKIVTSLMNSFNLDFNVFDLKMASNGQELLALMYYVFYHFDYFNLFTIKTTKFINFAKRVQGSYHNNPYHNATHGADVMQVYLS
jgi:hypothetical protein